MSAQQRLCIDKWIKMVNFKLNNRNWKVNWSTWHKRGTKQKIWVSDRNRTHDLLNTGWALYPLSYLNSWRARSFNWVHMFQRLYIVHSNRTFCKSCHLWSLLGSLAGQLHNHSPLGECIHVVSMLTVHEYILAINNDMIHLFGIHSTIISSLCSK